MLADGTRLGPFEIVAPLGAGGMGEVYRARDTNLHRDVAIKVLAEAFAADAERLARFEREARVLAALNHPNIAAIHGLERASTATVLVIELAVGETLAARVARGRLPADAAVAIAIQIAAALEAAHEKGIVHRDLKPANVVVSADGLVKVLDFGLAKAGAGGAGAAGGEGTAPGGADDAAALTHSPTVYGGTMAGVLLGTAAYMSPEQARGKAVDKRADIWAFGCVLYEMLTGKPAFAGDTLTDVVAAVVTHEPDWDRLPKGTPAPLHRVLRRCLRKDPARRLHDIADARIDLEDARSDDQPVARATQTPSAWRRAIWPLAAAAVAAGATLLGVRSTAPRSAAGAPAVTRLELDLPTGVEMYGGAAPGVAFAPDGRRIAYIGSLDGNRHIYLRGLDRFDSTALSGTEQAQSLFFSPDGSSLAFITADRTLKAVSLSDGLITVLARDTEQFAGGTWGADGRITVVRDGRLVQMAAFGGEPQPLTTLDASKHERLHIWPVALPNGAGLLFRSIAGDEGKSDQIEALVSATKERKLLVPGGALPLYAPSGHLVIVRDRDLLAAPFDSRRMEVTGPAVRAVSDVSVDFGGGPQASVSSTGSLVYAPAGTGTSHLVWVTREGIEQPIVEGATRYRSPRLAPNGQSVVVQIGASLWIHDLARGTLTRLVTRNVAMIGSGFTVWSPDGRHIAFRSQEGMRWLDVQSGGLSRALSPDSRNNGDVPTSISSDGESLLFIRLDAGTSGDLYLMSLRDGRVQPILRTPAYEGGAQLSPDGRWIAYVSDDSGRFEVYVRPLGGPDRRWPVSTQGGSFPVWRRDGKELFYRAGNKMMAVTVTIRSDEVILSAPRLLFDRQYPFEASTIPNYDISLDGTKFLMVKDDVGAGRLNIILNWTEELKRLAPTR